MRFMRDWMWVVVCSMLVVSQVFAGAEEAGEQDTPDWVRGTGPSVDEVPRGWFLHFYGSHGWIHGSSDAEREQARQILVTDVPRFSAIRDQVRRGDVILGVDGK